MGVHGVRAETCGGGVDHCNGLVDEAGAEWCIEYIRDVDGDGFGKTGDVQCLCEPTAPHAGDKGGDCNDGNDTVFVAVVVGAVALLRLGDFSAFLSSQSPPDDALCGASAAHGHSVGGSDRAGGLRARRQVAEGLAHHIGKETAKVTGGSRGSTMVALRELYDDVHFYVEDEALFDQKRPRRLAAKPGRPAGARANGRSKAAGVVTAHRAGCAVPRGRRPGRTIYEDGQDGRMAAFDPTALAETVGNLPRETRKNSHSCAKVDWPILRHANEY